MPLCGIICNKYLALSERGVCMGMWYTAVCIPHVFFFMFRGQLMITTDDNLSDVGVPYFQRNQIVHTIREL